MLGTPVGFRDWSITTMLRASDSTIRRRGLAARLCKYTLITGVVLVWMSTPVLAADPVTAFCESAMMETIRNVFTLIQFLGPLLGGILALGATVAMPAAQRPEQDMELKRIRNQAVVYGVLVAPLATTLLEFLLEHVVAGGASCAF